MPNEPIVDLLREKGEGRLIHLYLRRVDPDLERYRVIWKREGEEVELGSIGIQHRAGSTTDHWTWAIDTVIPMRDQEARGFGRDRRDCTKRFRAAWERFAADQANQVEFLEAKRRRR